MSLHWETSCPVAQLWTILLFTCLKNSWPVWSKCLARFSSGSREAPTTSKNHISFRCKKRTPLVPSCLDYDNLSLSIMQTIIWQWWMSLPKRPRDFHALRKHLQADQPLLNISKRLLDELLAALPEFAPVLVEFSIAYYNHSTSNLPLEVLRVTGLDLQVQQQHFITRNRRKATAAVVLEPVLRCDNIFEQAAKGCLLQWTYHWRCRKSMPCGSDLSAAMLATRRAFYSRIYWMIDVCSNHCHCGHC